MLTFNCLLVELMFYMVVMITVGLTMMMKRAIVKMIRMTIIKEGASLK